MAQTRTTINRKTILLMGAIVALLFSMAAFRAFSSQVRREGDNSYIVDRQGERWDVTQAAALGFRPEGFQFGLGRHAFSPLDDSFLQTPGTGIRRNLRVLGIQVGNETQAYSISRLSGHEIANSHIGKKSIAVAY